MSVISLHALAFLCLADAPGVVAPAVVDVDVRAVFGVAVAGFDRPVGAAVANDGSGRVFVVEQGGTVRVLLGGKRVDAPWLDVRAWIGGNHGEQGLLGIAFHPRFKENGRVFLAFTDKQERNAVAEVRVVVAGGAPDLATRRSWLAIEDPAGNHNGGHVLFGPDGKLWVGTGDGGGGGDPWRNAQDRGSLLGKMLRIDVDGGDATPEVWGRGLRNPWRYDFDPKTGDLWVADVGQNAWEEVNVVVDAAARVHQDFGWSNLEGRECFRTKACTALGTVSPAIVYSHDFANGGGCSVSGGVVVDGRFVFSDYCTGVVSVARRSGERVSVGVVGQSGRHPSTFVRDEAGALWLVDHGGALVPVALVPLRPTPPAGPPPVPAVGGSP